MDPKKKLYRIKAQKRIAGVCTGLEEYLGMDVTLIRVLFLASIIFGGFGIFLYVIMWIAVPYKPGEKIDPPLTTSNHFDN